MTYYDFVTSGGHKAYRRPVFEGRDLAAEFSAQYLPPEERMTRRFEYLCEAQEAHILDGQQIVFMRTTSDCPDVFTPEEWSEIKKTHFIHELGYTSNVTPDYARVLSRGLEDILGDENTNQYQRREIKALLSLTEKYRAEAERIGRDDVAGVLSQVPAKPPRNLREALQFFRIIHFSLWLEGTYHVTCGRFDKYMYPYYKADTDAGVLTDDEAIDLITDFFLSFNIDSDMYPGVQQGDNGQSMVLGGCDADGNDHFTRLSEICLIASGRNKLIDPKINMRVSKSTPADRFVKGSRLTAVGMGFPQYSNDDIVIPGLVKLGYDPKDAAEYGVAACWEFIVPGCGFDVANIAALSFPKVVDSVLHGEFRSCRTEDELKSAVQREIAAQCEKITSSIKNLWFVPAPFLSLFFDAPHGDVSKGSKYNNFGAHGTGISTAADSLAAMVKYVIEDKTVTADELIEAVDSDFEKHSELLPMLRNEAPKMGAENSDAADEWAVFLLKIFADEMREYRNCRGGCWRAGTGSAMYYLWHADEIGASPDGRRKGEPFGTNYSPSLFAKTAGPVSIIRSFTKAELINNVNGGPLTLEFDSSVFSEEDSPEKLGALVQYFIKLGGHQLQLNSVSREVLLDAQAHPEKYSRLIVRIWGWSAYFTELDKPYQDHVIARQEYKL
ncbi:MAG: pyruvate formate lyase family protein [Eubacteriales bacterium]